jgi:hypothetical protein
VHCVATPRTARVRMYSVRYIIWQAPSGTTSWLPLLLLPTAHRLTAAKPWNKSAARWQRALQSARTDIAQRFQRHVDLLLEKLAAVQQERAKEKDRRNAISAEHFTISQSLLRTQQLLDEARASGEARVQAVEVERAKELFVTWHRGSSVISLIFARSGGCRICYGNELPWTSRPLKHSLVACCRSGSKLVRTCLGTTRSETRRGLRSSLFARNNRQRLFARR